MKKSLLTLAGLALVLGCWAAPLRAQGGAAVKGPDPSVLVDAELEKEMKHELEVARHYFKMKKAYLAALNRSEYIVAGYDRFTRYDEALYLAGMSSLYLSEGKGKQKSPAQPDKLREQAREYLSRLVTEFPESNFRKEAQAELSRIGGAKKPEAQPEVAKPQPE
jgi:outer membrane protein assembly factor BamD (BamD/ComL family)